MQAMAHILPPKTDLRGAEVACSEVWSAERAGQANVQLPHSRPLQYADGTTDACATYVEWLKTKEKGFRAGGWRCPRADSFRVQPRGCSMFVVNCIIFTVLIGKRQLSVGCLKHSLSLAPSQIPACAFSRIVAFCLTRNSRGLKAAPSYYKNCFKHTVMFAVVHLALAESNMAGTTVSSESPDLIEPKQQQYVTMFDDMDDPYLQKVDGRELQQGTEVGATSLYSSSTAVHCQHSTG